MEWERGSPSQNERTLREVGEGSKTIKGEQGGGGVKTRESWAKVLFECPPRNNISQVEKERKFLRLLENLESAGQNFCFKIAIVKVINKYSKMKNGSLHLIFLRKNMKSKKEIRKEIRWNK